MRRFGLIGYSLKHSFSKKYFTEKFRQEGLINCSYENFELQQINDLPALLHAQPDLEGLNITIPYKEQVISFLDEMDEVVKTTGACNCIHIHNGKLTGFNTDAPAFQQSLQQHLQPHHRSALVLGTGGASKAVCFALTQLKIDFQLVSRNRKENHLTYDGVTPELLRKYFIIINTTPVVNQDIPRSNNLFQLIPILGADIQGR